MFVRISNTPRDYSWGSTTAIADLLGTAPSGKPEAELWLGAHPSCPSQILDPSQTGGATDLAHLSATAGKLPYLLKVLAAASPLSLQAHPSPAHAQVGFERENNAGLALDSPERNYKDPLHKPEMILALSDPFDALCGFREPRDSQTALTQLADGSAVVTRFAAMLDGEPAVALRLATGWLLGGSAEVTTLVDTVVSAARDTDTVDADTVRMLAAAFPGDPGIVLSLLLNRVALQPGEALYLPAGNIHAYLRGLGIELMAASDNVLRGGLTPKRIDVPELMNVLDFTPFAVTPMARERPAPGVEEFVPDIPDFRLTRIQVGGDVPSTQANVRGTAIALCTAGEVELKGTTDTLRLSRGECVLLTDERELSITSGTGTLFLATPNR